MHKRCFVTLLVFLLHTAAHKHPFKVTQLTAVSFYFTPFDSNDGVLLIYPDVGSHVNKMRGSIVEKLYYIHSSTSLEM